MALFKIYQEKSGSFRVLLKLDEQIEFVSRRQKSKLECYQLIKRIRKLSQSNTSYIKRMSECGSVFFTLTDLSIKCEFGDSMLYVNTRVLDTKIAMMKAMTASAVLDSEMYSI